MNGKVVLVEVRRAANGFRVMDAQRREHHAVDERELGALIVELLEDSSMPPVEEVRYDPAVSVFVGLIGRVVPQYRSLALAAEPLAQQIVPHLRRKQRGES